MQVSTYVEALCAAIDAAAERYDALEAVKRTLRSLRTGDR